jgi:triosephosphate isomerase
MRRKLVAGNWKMHGDRRFAAALLDEIAAAPQLPAVEIAIFPPMPYLSELIGRYQSQGLQFGAQDVSARDQGAYTGEVSAAMLRSLFCTHVILGHSERRTYFGEDDAFFNRKVLAALQAGLRPILCVGETLAEREANKTLDVVKRHVTLGLRGVPAEAAGDVIVAYEPVWAIGTGKVATTAQAQEVHAFIRGLLAEQFGDGAQRIRILYGGSMKPSNAPELLEQPDIDGGLIGGASLESASYLALVDAAAKAKA